MKALFWMMVKTVAAVVGGVGGPMAYRAFAGDGKAQTSDWPQWRGPNRDGIVVNSPKLLDSWPTNGPQLLWKSDPLPFAPTCGVGSPVVTGGKMYTYAQIPVPMEGVKPFTVELLARWGWAEGMPDDLGKKLDTATFYNQKYREACKTPVTKEAYIKEFLATLDPAQTQKFGSAIQAWMQWKAPVFDHPSLAWLGAFKDKEIKTRQDFMNLFIDRFGGRLYHDGQADEVTRHADTVYKAQKWADALICLDAGTGKILWRKEFPGVKKSWGVEFGCSGVPAIVTDRIYFAGSGGVYCLDIARNGELVWQGKGAASHTSPVIAEGVAYFCAGELAAFHADTGRELWRQPKVSNECGSPALWKHNGKTYVLCVGSGAACCVDAANGELLWRDGDYGWYGSLTISGDIMVARGGGSFGCVAYRLSPQKAEPLWQSKEGGDYGGSPIIYQDHVYCCGHAYSKELDTVLDLKTGAVTVKFCEGNYENGGECSTAVIADGKVIFVTQASYKVGRLVMFKTTPDKYEEVGRMPDKEVVSCTSPAFVDGKVYVRMPMAIACYDLRATAK